MVIPDMLKNAPMFKRLEARIKVPIYCTLACFFILTLLFLMLLIVIYFLIMKGKGSSLGVGRGRAVAMRARVRSFPYVR